MCRLAAYMGKEIKLSRFLYEPEHNLVKQSWAAKEMREASLNADGFGIAWLTEKNTPYAYKNTCPIWSDTNLEGLAQSIRSRLWVANVRSATPGQDVSTANTQPFIGDNLIFTHNGYLKPFDNNHKKRLFNLISDDIRIGINGNSDSQYLYSLLREYLLNALSLAEAIVKMMPALENYCADANKETALLNMILSDGKSLYACRHALNGDCPSLYYLSRQDSIQIASEPLTPGDNWVAFPEHRLIVFDCTGITDESPL